jgi:hypothetical protein
MDVNTRESLQKVLRQNPAAVSDEGDVMRATFALTMKYQCSAWHGRCSPKLGL